MRIISAVMVAAVLAIGVSASADPTVFTINSFSSSSDGSPTEDFTIASYVFGSEDYIDSIDDGLPGFFNITVNSGPSDRQGFDYDLFLDYSAYDIGFFLDGSGPGVHRISLLDVKGDGSISDVAVKTADGSSIGSIVTDGNSIFWDTTVEDVLGAIGVDRSLPITIQWAQAPAPGALALLGLAGLGMRRRRRG